jgi:hypothetical protein
MAAYLGKHVAQGQRDFREREVEEHIDSSRHAQDADDQDAEAAASFEAMCANSLREMQR